MGTVVRGKTVWNESSYKLDKPVTLLPNATLSIIGDDVNNPIKIEFLKGSSIRLNEDCGLFVKNAEFFSLDGMGEGIHLVLFGFFNHQQQPTTFL